MKIIKYELLCELDMNVLNRNVDEKINEGWQPYGNPYSVYVKYIGTYNYQAVVMIEKQKIPYSSFIKNEERIDI